MDYGLKNTLNSNGTEKRDEEKKYSSTLVKKGRIEKEFPTKLIMWQFKIANFGFRTFILMILGPSIYYTLHYLPIYRNYLAIIILFIINDITVSATSWIFF